MYKSMLSAKSSLDKLRSIEDKCVLKRLHVEGKEKMQGDALVTIGHCSDPIEVRDTEQQLAKLEAAIEKASGLTEDCSLLSAFSNDALKSHLGRPPLFATNKESKEDEGKRVCDLQLLYQDCTGVECVLQSAASAGRLCEDLVQRQSHLKALIKARKASTSQRRSLMVHTVLVPVISRFVETIMLSLEIFTLREASSAGVKFAQGCLGVLGRIEREVQKQSLHEAVSAATAFLSTKASKSYKAELTTSL